ncbi:rhomboid family intramembrane serine protease [Leptospira idonii]|uniref:Rhomboid family intramembrane serine protease n=2 Tax=Leptospira idonii TaxID=1193500 RepID=A0A4R9M419_9LEPT|nr:rhomboid family intramembrane serine protease [Leptospira idonii]
MAPRYPSYETRFGPELTTVVRALLVANGIVFVLQFLENLILKTSWIGGILALNPALVLKGFVWQVVTYSFLHVQFWNLLMNMLMLWMFGGQLEEHWGSKPFLKFYIFSNLAGALAAVIAAFFGMSPGIVVGASSAVYALLFAYALTWPNREMLFMLIFPLKAKYVAILFMLILLFSGGGAIVYTSLIGGVVSAFFLVRFYSGWKKISSGSSSWSLSRYLQKRRFLRYQQEMENRENAKDRVDKLLEKISKEGMDSLSRSEKKFLNDASQKYFNE